MKPSFEQTLVEVWRQTLVEDAKAEGYFCQPSWLPGFSKSRKPNKQVPTSLSDGSRMEFLRTTGRKKPFHRLYRTRRQHNAGQPGYQTRQHF